jgi:hypothetical protein
LPFLKLLVIRRKFGILDHRHAELSLVTGAGAALRGYVLYRREVEEKTIEQ